MELSIHNLLVCLTLAGSFLPVLLDAVIARPVGWKRRALGLTTALLGMISAPLIMQKGYWFLPVLLFGALAFGYSRQMIGFGKRLVACGWATLCCAAFSQLSPASSVLFEVSTLLLSLLLWVMPVLLLWHVWRTLPLVYDAVSGGDWINQGIPLRVRYGFLVVAALISLAANVFFYVQWSSDRAVLVQQENDALYQMWFKLGYVRHSLAHRGEPDFVDWKQNAEQYLREYSQAAWRAAHCLRINGVSSGNPFHFLAITLPDGLAQAITQGDNLTASDAESLLAVLDTTTGALENAFSANRFRSIKAYQKVVDQIIAQLDKTEALRLFDVQYRPK